MPNMEDTRVRCTNDFDVAPDVFSVERNILATPAYNVLIKAANS